MSSRKRTLPEPAEENPAEKRARMQEGVQRALAEAERSRQAAVNAENAALEVERELALLEEECQRKEEDERKRKAEEARKRADAKKAEEAKKKTDAKKKQGVENKVQNGKGKSRQEMEQGDDEMDGEEEAPTKNTRRNVDHSDGEWQPAPANNTRSSKARKNALKMPSMINDAGQDISNDIVEGSAYPSCMACLKAENPCQWKMSVIHLRLSGLPNKAKNCEACIRKQVGCQFIWERDGNLKHLAEEALEPEPLKIQLDCPDLITCMQSIDKNISAILKFTAAQDKQ